MKTSFLSLLVCFSYFSFSQTHSYKILKDDPSNPKRFTIHLDPFYAEAWGTNITLGYGVRGDVLLTKRLSLNGAFRKAYLDMNARSHFDGSLAVPKNDFNKLTYMEASGSLHLIDKIKKKPLKVVLSSSTTYSGNYKYTHTKYIMVPGSVRRITGIHGGVSFLNTAIDFDEGDAISTWKATQGNETVTFGDYGKTVHGSSVYNGYSQMRTATLFGGLTLKSITNLATKVEGYSKTKGNFSYVDFFADVMFAPVLSYQDVKFKDGTTFKLENNSNKRTGWRIGMSWKNPTKTYLSYSFEFGQRPGYEGEKKGVLNNRTYLNLVMGWSIPFNLKAKK
ncbi:MAG: hypothetical protein H6605_10725 [Flavobacteriales bacterium]|nr:hypothetical protein [Flavobacteriales bacterium]